MTDNSNQRKTHWEKKIDDCKKRHRPCLKNWSRDQFALKRKADFDKLKSLHLKIPQIGYIDAFQNSVDEFRNSYEKNSIPCIIQNVPVKENWSSVTNWTPTLLKENYRHRLFKCGEDDDGYKVKIKMKYFIKYMKDNVDDSPLYIFDSNYDDDSVSKALLKDYKVPDYFPEDLFSLVGEDRRPPYRWFLVGPERSGTTVHLDPLGTSAWNTLIKGRKRWVLFPPDTDKNIAKGKDVIIKGEDDESVNYFVDLLPRIKEKHKDLQIMEVIQEEGETIFVPSGWWHGVLNLTDTIAITQVKPLIFFYTFHLLNLFICFF